MAQDISKMETTKTAVQWLFEQIQNGNITSEETACGYFVMIDNDCLNKAKEMEKAQIIDADLNATIRTATGANSVFSVRRVKELAEQYYNETYNK